MKKIFSKHNFIFSLAIILTIVLDQVLKIVLTDKNLVIIKGFLEFTYVENTGAAFSMLSGARWFFIPFTIIIVAILIYVFIANKNKNVLFSLSAGLIIGGALGNLVDRIIFGFVKDFINFTFFPAIFNIADVCITIGAILLIIYILFFNKKEKKSGENNI